MKYGNLLRCSNLMTKYTRKAFSSNDEEQIVILMTGAPGVGKGTFSKMLSKDLKIPEFSTGDELRKMINSKDTKDEQTLKIQQIVKEGKLVDDNFMFQIVSNRLKHPDTAKGIILDGYPRNLNQAKQFQQVNLVLDIYLDDDILIPKMLGRRLCKCCGNNYNVFSIKERGYDMDPLLPSKDINKCDDCNEPLIMREDDKDEIIKDRLEVFRKHTFPLLEFYEKQNKLIKFEPKRGKKDYPQLKDIVLKHLKH